jgi:vancomycin resistance protein YoaR
MRDGADSEVTGAGAAGAERREAPAPPTAPSPPTLRDSSRMARRQGKRRRVRRVAVVVLVALLVVGPLVALEVWLQDRVGLGVAVAGVSLQGADEGDARDRLVAELAARVEPVRLETREGTYETTLAELGVRVDFEATAAAAAGAGWRRLPLGLEVWLPGEGDVAPVVTVDDKVFAAGVEAAGGELGRAPRDARLRWNGEDLEVTLSEDGLGIDAEALRAALVAAAKAGRPFEGPAPTAVITPEVTTEQARERLPIARLYLARPLELRLKSRRIVLQPELMAGMLSVNRGEDADVAPLTFDNAEARRTLRRLFARVERPAADARFVVSSAGRLTIEPSRAGVALDMDELLADLDAAASGGGRRSVHVAVVPVEPRLSTEEAERNGLASQGAQFVTYFDTANAARVQNIARAAGLADGTVIPPGATFSLNQTLGPRSVNRGFDYAPVIAGDGVLRQGVGGGICQYATTLFNAAFFAGLPIVERHPHGLFIDHYPVGRDATVSWGGPDLKFRNDTGASLTLRSWVRGHALTVALVGKTGRTVTYETGPFTNVRKPSYGKSDPRVVFDEDLSKGVVRWERGGDGRTVRVTRVVKQGDRVLIRDTFVSTYRPMDWIKRVGTGG